MVLEVFEHIVSFIDFFQRLVVLVIRNQMYTIM